MSEHNSNLYTKQTADQGGKMLPVDLGGKIRVAHDVIVLASSAAIGDKINLARLPKGARILETSELRFASGLGASVTIKVGDAGDDDRYLAAKAPGASGAVVRLDALGFTSGGYTLPAETVIFATVGGAAIASGTKIGMQLEYVDF